jgi:hypothetical protein
MMTVEEEENRLKALTRRGSSKTKEKSAHSDLTQTIASHRLDKRNAVTYSLFIN